MYSTGFYDKMYSILMYFLYTTQDTMGILGKLDHLILNHALMPDAAVWTGSYENVTLLER